MEQATLSAMLIALVVLLPLVPAVILFKFLPSKALVSGPFKGLKINFGGAFAGYFVVLLVARGYVPTNFSSYETWKVVGEIALQPTSDDVDTAEAELSVKFVPPHTEVPTPGPFMFEEVPVLVRPDGTRVFPMMYVTARGYQTQSFSLDTEHPSHDTSNVEDKEQRPYGSVKVEVEERPNKTIAIKQLTLKPSTYKAEDAVTPKPVGESPIKKW